MINVSAGRLAEILGGKLRLGGMPPIGGAMEPVGPVVTDSRAVRAGDLFWGLSGNRHDGSRFAEEAFCRGAAGAVVSGRRIEPFAGAFAIEVEDSRWALWKTADWARSRFRGRLIAVTGGSASSPKAELIDSVLASRGTGSILPILSSKPHPLDVAAAMLHLDKEHDYAVLTFPATDDAEWEALARIARPDLCVIGAGEADRSSAADWSRRLRRLPAACRIVAADSRETLQNAASRSTADIVVTGRSAAASLRADRVALKGTTLTFAVDDEPVTLNSVGRGHLDDALAALAVGRIVGCEMSSAAAAISRRAAGEIGRRIRARQGITVIEATGHGDIAGARVGLDLLRETEAEGRKVVLCGDCWGRARRGAAVCFASEAVTRGAADLLVAAGPFAGEIASAAMAAGLPAECAIVAAGVDEAARQIACLVRAGDVVLMEGTGNETGERVFAALKNQRPARPSAAKGSRKTGWTARDKSFEVPPKAPVLRENGATLPPGLEH